MGSDGVNFLDGNLTIVGITNGLVTFDANGNDVLTLYNPGKARPDLHAALRPSLGVFLVVLASAALHATWNAVIRGASDRLLTTILIAGSVAPGRASLPALPAAVSAQSWPYLVVSAVLEITYYALVGLAYSHAEMSHAYPLMRGTPPFIIAAISALALNTPLHPAGWAGIALISTGILSLAFMGGQRHDPRGTRFALANAVVIAAYTLVDGFGVRASGQPATYAMWIFVLTGVPLAAWAILRRPEIVSYARRNWTSA